MYVCIHTIYIYIYTYTHIHIYIYTYIHAAVHSSRATAWAPLTVPSAVSVFQFSAIQLLLNNDACTQHSERPARARNGAHDNYGRLHDGMYVCICVYMYVNNVSS